MIELGLDIETTGLEIGDHRIIEIYLGLYKDEKLVFEYEQRINPERGIAADAQRVHGISATDLIGKPTWPAVAPIVQKVCAKAHRYVAHNGKEFDIKFLEYEMKRVGLALPKRPLVDTMLEGVFATPDGKKPNLAELCFACGVEYDKTKAHAAPYDVRDTMMPAFFNARRWGFIDRPDQAAA